MGWSQAVKAGHYTLDEGGLTAFVLGRDVNLQKNDHQKSPRPYERRKSRRSDQRLYSPAISLEYCSFHTSFASNSSHSFWSHLTER